MRLIHISDVHVWRYDFLPWRLMNKRAIGMAGLVLRRARKFRLERLKEVVARIASLNADHILISGDLTTTALPSEFLAARHALADLIADPARVTVIPGNHDRYTGHSVRSLAFERSFGEFAPRHQYPWLRPLDGKTTILGLDPTRSHLSATGLLPPRQFDEARQLLADMSDPHQRLIVACHYPVVAPETYRKELHSKRLTNADTLKPWLAGLGPHLYCCGHVHAAWAFRPTDIPHQLCLNAGAPLLRDHTGNRPPGFLEIDLKNEGVSVTHHAWLGDEWEMRPLFEDRHFFNGTGRSDQPSREATRI